MLVAISTAGNVFSPLFIWCGKNVQLKEETDLPPNILISATPKGFMTREIFTQWISKFIEEAQITLETPGLLILDAHESRNNLDEIELAKSSGLQLIILPGKSTHLLQPSERIQEVFACTGIEPFMSLTTIEKIFPPPVPDVSDRDLNNILSQTIIFNKNEQPKGKKRFSIANRIATSEEVIQELVEKKK